MPTISLYPIVANGNSYNAASFAALGYVTALPAAITDVIAQAAKLFASTSSTSATIANSGTISITVGTGLAFTVGQYILCSAQPSPQINFMSGTVTSYVTGSGALQFTANAASGSGTFTAWYVNSCSYNNSLGLTQTNYGIVNSVLGTDQGSIGCPLSLTTGNSYYDNQRAGVFIGIESPNTAMVEVFEDFLSVGNLYINSYYSDNTISVPPPWWTNNSSSLVSGYTPGQITLSTQIYGTSGALFQGPSVLTYGNSGGYIHVGKGALIMEWLVKPGTAQVGPQFSFGLSACGSVSPVYDIFSNGGIGFNVNPSGYFECIAGIAGQITRIPTTIFVYGGYLTYRCRVEIDHTGLNAYYYINDILVAKVQPSNGPVGGTEARNLLMVAAEARSDTVIGLQSAMVIYSFYLAKYLSR